MDGTLRALADHKRCDIMRLVWSEEQSASAIAAHFPEVTRPAISQHLQVLRRAGLVAERREGTRRLYRARHDELARLRAFVDSFWDRSLDQLRDLAEAAADAGGS